MAIDVRRDAWGVPFLRASDARELAFAQGREAAYDRAWQLETERHRALGVTAAYLGRPGLAWDLFARRARLADTARRCFARLAPETRAWVAAYAEGVDAGMAEGAARAPEFARAGVEPGPWRPWTPLAVWLSVHILFAGFPTKLWREEVARRLGDDAVHLFATDGPRSAGSNGWLVPGDRTAGGAPLVAGDPHRLIEEPGVYQQIRLACPQFDVTGLAVPGVPGIAHFAHTGHVAWAITHAMADYQDLYAERLSRRGDAVQAQGPDGLRPARAHTETVQVADADPVTVEVIETDRGPVVVGGPDEPDGRAISLRCPARVHADVGFDALPALLQARTVADVDRALEKWVEPVNVVLAADTSGGLLHRTAGRVPDRDPENRLRVVPAWEPRHAWRDRDLPMPRARLAGDADDGGVAVMANERGLAEPLGVEFAAPHRAARIRELLQAREKWTAGDMACVHTDTLLPSADALLDVLAGAPGLGPAAARLRDRLLSWNRRMDADSTDAGTYAALRSAVARRLAAHPAFAALAGPQLAACYPEVFRPWLDLAPRIAFALERLLRHGPVPAGDVAELVREAAEEVTRGTPGKWGDTHRLSPWSALSAATDTAGTAATPGLSGDHDCVLSTSSVPGVTDLVARGPAARYVWDLARREDSRWIVPLGASGVPGDPHHRDQLPLWLRGELIPVPTEERPDVTTREAPHEQYVDGFGTVRVGLVDPEHDTDLIHSWVTEHRARFWGMAGSDRETVREIYRHLDSLTTHHAYLVHRDGRPVALFQTYDPAADRVGECYDVQPGDFGVHLLTGPGFTRERDFTARLLTALTGFVLADPAHRRVVVEPDARNDKALRRLSLSGFTLGPEVTLPEVEGHLPAKRARLAFLPLPGRDTTSP